MQWTSDMKGKAFPELDRNPRVRKQNQQIIMPRVLQYIDDSKAGKKKMCQSSVELVLLMYILNLMGMVKCNVYHLT